MLLALSGGVDSTMAAQALLRQGCDVTALYLILHGPGLAEVQRARRSAQELGVRLIELDLRDRFADRVMQPFQEAWAAGKTPNPCVICNRTIKFGALLDFAEQEGYAALATGHYARTVTAPNGRTLLLRGTDPHKDQSYFLAGLNQRQLAFARFPLGDCQKSQIRHTAEQAGFSASADRESQDVCFLPDGDYAAWLEARGFAFTSGSFITADGTVLGPHRGAERYTPGQRRGLGLALGSRSYVTGRAGCDVVVGPPEDLFSKTVFLGPLNCIAEPCLTGPAEVSVKLRYRQTPARAVLTPLEHGARLDFSEPQRAPAPGQLAVCYQGDIVYAGAEILSAGRIR